MKTIVIMGMLVKSPSRGHTRGDYADINIAYNVDDSVTIDDVIFYIDKRVNRSVPLRWQTGEKLDYVVGIDRDRNTGKAPMNRVAFTRMLARDIDNLDWHTDSSERR